MAEKVKKDNNKKAKNDPEQTSQKQTVVTTPTPSATPATAPVVATTTEVFAPQDVTANKVWAVVSYLGLVGILIVLLAECKDSPYAKFHLNQSLLLTIFAAIGTAVSLAIPILGWFILLPVMQTAIMVLWILGVIYAAQGQAKRLPIIGSYDLVS